MNEMIDEEILAPLRGDPPGQPRIDVPRAMVEGLRRRRHRQWASGVAVAAAVALAATGGLLTTRLHAAPAPVATTPPPTSCTVAQLPSGDGSRTDVVDGDPSGYLLGEQLPKGGNWSKPIIWKNGVIVSSPPVPAGHQVFAAINNHGVAVGSSMYDLVFQGYVLRDGVITKLRGGDSDAGGINDAGVIVGYVGHNSPPKKLDAVPVRWPSADAAPQRLAFAAGWQFGEADGIAADGTIWGTFGREDASRHFTYVGALWLPDGTLRVLTLPPSMSAPDHSQRYPNYFRPVTRAGDWLYGRLGDGSPGLGHRARYSIGHQRFEVLPDPEGSVAGSGVAGAFADNGWAPGYQQVPGGTPHDIRPALLAGSTTVGLPVPADVEAGVRGPAGNWYMAAISHDGRTVAGTATWSDKKTEVPNDESFVWTCK